MKWKKLGQIFAPNKEYPWMLSHAAAPVLLHLENDVYRIYFACRDDQNHSHGGYVEIDLKDPQHILNLSTKPVLEPGGWGYFDDHGVYPSSIVAHDDKLYMYYIGWIPGTPSPLFYSTIGLAISEDNGLTFQKVSNIPIVGRGIHDPLLVTAPHVLKEEDLWRMWYVSGLRWEETEVGLKSYYHIKYAESDDGINWNRDGIVAFDLQENESNIARASVLKVGDDYLGWYSYVAGDQSYRIGYAESPDGIYWQRKDDKAGIDVSESGWDSEMVAYPQVFVHDNKRYMIYNGNGFGRTGFGIAVEQDTD